MSIVNVSETPVSSDDTLEMHTYLHAECHLGEEKETGFSETSTTLNGVLYCLVQRI